MGSPFYNSFKSVWVGVFVQTFAQRQLVNAAIVVVGVKDTTWGETMNGKLRGAVVLSILLTCSTVFMPLLGSAVARAQSTTTAVTFQVDNSNTSPGQSVYITGNIPALGGWKTAIGPFSGTGYPLWTDTINIPAGTAFQYKYVVAPSGNGSVSTSGVAWAQGSNQVAQLPQGATDTIDSAYQSASSASSSAPTISTAQLPRATTGDAYATSLVNFADGAHPYTWMLASGALPSGLTLASDGTITGTPSAAGTFAFTVKATDAKNGSATQSLSMTVVQGAAASASVSVAPSSIVAGYASASLQITGVGTSFSQDQTTVHLADAANGSTNLTSDMTVNSPTSLSITLPSGNQGIGAGDYTLTVATGSATETAAVTVSPYTTANTLQWDGIFTSQSSPYLSAQSPAPGSSVTVGFRAFSGNLTSATLNYYDTAQNKSFTVPMTPGATFGPYQLWTATIPASNGGTIWYRFDLSDGQSFACLTGSGLQASDTTNNNLSIPAGGVSLSALQAGAGATVTASDASGDFSGGTTSVQFVNSAGQVAGTVQGENAGFSTVQFQVPSSLTNGQYTVNLTTQAKDANGVVNTELNRSTVLAVGSGTYWFNALKHDSYSSFYRSPFGAVPTGTAITLRLRGPIGLSAATVRVWNAAGNPNETDIAMQPVTMSDSAITAATGDVAANYSWWQATIPASDVSALGTMWYQFKVTYDGQTLYYDDNSSQLEGVGQPSVSASGPSYQISTYEPSFQTPNWLKHAVIYEIFPDRFFNGNLAINENPNTQKAVGTLANGQEGLVPIEFHKHWSSLPYDPAITATPGTPNYQQELKLRGNGQWNMDFFGGNLRGIEYKLDYLKSLGVNTLYLTPIFQADSVHKYNTGNFMQIDPGFGTLQDYLNLIQAAKARGMHVILDVAFEDTGSNSVYFNKFGNYNSVGAWQEYQNPSVKSPYYNWFQWTGNPAVPYNSWFGYDTLPLTNTNSKSYQNFVYGGQNSVAKYWLSQGASGYRLDSADNFNFNVPWWSAFRKAVKSVDPNAAIIGEIWNNASNDPGSTPSGTNWLTGQTFDSVMNYQFRNAVLDFFRGNYNDGNETHQAVNASGFNQRLMRLYSEYPLQSFYAMMNLVDSQDTMRILTVLEGAPSPSGMTPFAQATWQPTAAQQQLGIEKLKLVSDFQFGFPGAPTIWYGDEAGVTGYKDPLNRQTYPWGHANEVLLNHYRKLGAIRNANPVLQTGAFAPLYEQGGVYAFARTITGGADVFGDPAQNASAIEVLNNSASPAAVSIPVNGTVADGARLLDELNNQWYTVQNGAIQMNLAAYQGAILVTTSAPVAYMQNIGTGTDLSWTPVASATGYQVNEQNVSGQWQPVGGVLPASQLSKDITALRGAEAVQVKVTAMTAAGAVVSNASTIPAANLTMGSVAQTATETGNMLSWRALPYASQYDVYQLNSAGGYSLVQTVPGNGGGTTVNTTVAGNSSSVYRVAAENEDNYSLSGAATALGVPTNVHVTDTTATDTTLSWNGVTDAASYDVFENGRTAPMATNVMKATYDVTGLTPNTPYTFTVSALTAQGVSSPPSAPVSVTTLPSAADAVTLGLSNISVTQAVYTVQSGQPVTVTGTVFGAHQVVIPNASVTLSSTAGAWSGPGTGSETVTANVYGAFTGQWLAPTETSLTPITVTASVGGITNHVAVDVLPLPTNAPGVPTNVQATATIATGATLSWNGVANAASYDVFENGRTAPIATNVMKTTYDVTGLTPNTPYTFTVSALTAQGVSSPPSAPVSVTTVPRAADAMTLGLSNVSVAQAVYTVQSGQSETVMGTVFGGQQVAIPNASVTLSSTAGAWSGSGTASETVTTNGVGAFSENWQAPSETTLTPVTVTASVYGISNHIAVDVLPTPPTIPGNAGAPTVTHPKIPVIPVAPTEPFSTGARLILATAGGSNTLTVGHSQLTVSVASSQTVPGSDMLTITSEKTASVSNVSINVPNKTIVTSAFGVRYSRLGFALKLTVTNPQIQVGSAVDEWINGKLTQLPAKVEQGKLTVRLTNSADLVVLTPRPMLIPFNQREITWNGEPHPYTAFVKTDPISGIKTTYMPIWYIMKVLDQAGIQSAWNGKQWAMTTGHAVNLSGAQPLGKRNTAITLNGTPVESVPGMVAEDPRHGNLTTYMPIWYVMQALRRAGIRSEWTGSLWALYPPLS